MFEIIDNNVLTVKEVTTKRQTAIVKEFYCYPKKIQLSAAGNLVQTKWQKFDTALGGFVADPENNTPITLDVAGIPVTIDPAEGGIEFVTAEPGDHVIRSVNELVENSEVTIHA